MITMARGYWHRLFGWRVRQAVRRKVRRLCQRNMVYDAAFFDAIDTSSSASANRMALDIMRVTGARSVYDVGCGAGQLLNSFRRAGCSSVSGCDGSAVAVHRVRERGISATVVDLRNPPVAKCRYDVCTCLEVAEHIDARHADKLIKYLCSTAPVVVFSAATPGQGGHDHRNEQPHEYWVRKMALHGFALDNAATEELRASWHKDRNVAAWYSRNVMLFSSQASS